MLTNPGASKVRFIRSFKSVAHECSRHPETRNDQFVKEIHNQCISISANFASASIHTTTTSRRLLEGPPFANQFPFRRWMPESTSRQLTDEFG